MQIGRIQGFTRELGKSQGYMGLPVRDGSINCTVSGPETPTMTTAWLPTPAELAALNAGASVHVRLLGISHPPIMVEVGEVPAQDAVSLPVDEAVDVDPAAADFIERRCARLIGDLA
jgi:hypothetical protein